MLAAHAFAREARTYAPQCDVQMAVYTFGRHGPSWLQHLRARLLPGLLHVLSSLQDPLHWCGSSRVCLGEPPRQHVLGGARLWQPPCSL